MAKTGTSRIRTSFSRAIGFLASLKLSIILFLTLALTSALGTFIQQQRNPVAYISTYGPTAAKALMALGFADLYHSWWFQLLLALLLANTFICSFRRLPSALALMRGAQFLDTKKLKSKRLSRSWKIGDSSSEEIEEILFGAFGKLEHDGASRWFGQRQRWARLGPYIAHVSLALFFIGGLASAQYGLKGRVNIYEGDSVATVNLNSGKKLELPFELTCLKFELQKYPDGRPRDYLSTIEVRRGGEVKLTKVVEVNDPLIVDSIYFYQSNYGGFEGGALVSVEDRDGGELIAPRVLQQEQMVALPGLELKLELLSFHEEFKGYGPTAEFVLVDTSDDGHVHVGDPFVVLQRMPGYDRRRNADYVVKLEEIKPPKRYTGLQVTKDPGVPFIWVGALLMTLGALASSFASHKRYWAALEDGELTVAGFSAKDREGFAERFGKMADKIKGKTLIALSISTDETNGERPED